MQKSTENVAISLKLFCQSAKFQTICLSVLELRVVTFPVGYHSKCVRGLRYSDLRRDLVDRSSGWSMAAGRGLRNDGGQLSCAGAPPRPQRLSRPPAVWERFVGDFEVLDDVDLGTLAGRQRCEWTTTNLHGAELRQIVFHLTKAPWCKTCFRPELKTRSDSACPWPAPAVAETC